MIAVVHPDEHCVLRGDILKAAIKEDLENGLWIMMATMMIMTRSMMMISMMMVISMMAVMMMMIIMIIVIIEWG